MKPTPENLGRWSLERVRFLLGHIESFVESGAPDEDLRARVKAFSPQTDVQTVENLVLADPNDAALPTLVLERLTPFFESGLLLQRGPARGWYVTDVFGRGTTFHLELADQVRADDVVPEITPLQVHRADAAAPLAKLNLAFLLPAPEAQAYLMRPTPTSCFVLVSNLAPPFAVDHVAKVHELINKCFIY